ncbi:homocitrate synthase/isopropylmalate synthase family protein [Sporomusa sphaeroides]|uniref:homocitrate synthase/isopropylmalate synthase family protein n=1 Tax=Sporomusa sphaeroides TaxID=47679 RepID=UPI002B69B2AD|nr:hypothetical protein [Sporomusa sphaeroides]HML33578.1 hypothetical protein [Sporomusa sphaeroides]
MRRLTWHDQTLNTAIHWQCSDRQLEELARLLAGLGIRQADICLDGWRRYCPDLKGVQKYLHLRGRTSLAEPELGLAEQLGMKGVALVCNAARQDRFNLLLASAMRDADRRCLQSSLQLEDIAVLSAPELAAIAEQVNGYDVASIIYDDRKAKGDPLSAFEQLVIIIRKVNCPVEVCLGNAFGLATANSLAAVKAGITHITTAVAGIGGYAPWEEVVFAVKQLLGFDYELPQDMAGICWQAAAVLELSVPESKAIIGQSIFAHESGLHVDGVIKSPELYEPFSPELVGLKRQLIIGKHSGSIAIKTKFSAWGIGLEDVECKHLLDRVRTLAVKKKAAITDTELLQLYRSSLKEQNYART